MRKRPQKAARLALGVATLGGIGLLGAFGAGAAGAAAPGFGPGASPVIGHVYLDDNTARHKHDQRFRPPPRRFPHAACGVSLRRRRRRHGRSVGSHRRARSQVTNDGRFLIAVDAGSNQVSVLRINFDGSLQLVPNGVVSSDGPTPVSVAGA